MDNLDTLTKLINAFRALPGVGYKTAQRYAYGVLNMEQNDVNNFAQCLVDAKQKIHFCKECGNFSEKEIALEENYEDERRRCQSLVGPHRDDIVFFITDKESTKFASQGQQRTIVLALKMAEIDIIKEKAGTSPILLLDDVLAELDDLRQNYLLNSIDRETQTIITSVDTLFFNEEFLKDVKIFKINNGKVIE